MTENKVGENKVLFIPLRSPPFYQRFRESENTKPHNEIKSEHTYLGNLNFLLDVNVREGRCARLAAVDAALAQLPPMGEGLYCELPLPHYL